jgi:DNA-binding response OmpR family regulator
MRVDYLVTKPVDLDELKSALMQMLGRRKSHAANGRKRRKAITYG